MQLKYLIIDVNTCISNYSQKIQVAYGTIANRESLEGISTRQALQRRIARKYCVFGATFQR